MSSDEIIPAKVSGFRYAGGGMSMHFRCAACDRNSPQLGSGVRRVHGVRAKVCADCKLPKASP